MLHVTELRMQYRLASHTCILPIAVVQQVYTLRSMCVPLWFYVTTSPVHVLSPRVYESVLVDTCSFIVVYAIIL